MSEREAAGHSYQREHLIQLANDPAWAELRKLAKERMEAHFDRLSREFALKDARPTFEELQWQRGFFAGMKYLLDNPTLEAKKFERQLASRSE